MKLSEWAGIPPQVLTRQVGEETVILSSLTNPFNFYEV